MTESTAMGRPKIDGLVRFQLRLHEDQLAAMKAAVAREVAGGKIDATLTTAMRDAFDLWLAAHPAPKKRPKKGGAA